MLKVPGAAGDYREFIRNTYNAGFNAGVVSGMKWVDKAFNQEKNNEKVLEETTSH
jgi:hypothetical protein